MDANLRERLTALDRLSYVDVIGLLDRGASVYYDGPEGAVVTLGESSLSSVVCTGAWEAMLSHLDLSADLICVHDEGLRDYLVDRCGYGNEEGCFSYSWWAGPMSVPQCDSRILDVSYIDTIESVYKLAGREELLSDLSSGMVTGLFEDGLLVGFIGFHPEGSMGMLHVFEEHRKKGYGELLEKIDINRALDMGIVPYCHVFFSNKASRSLQEKLGLGRGERPVWWLWKQI